jgi:hypothetical protein
MQRHLLYRPPFLCPRARYCKYSSSLSQSQRNLHAFSEGVDGPWSSFELRVGTPAQNVRIFPGTSSTQTLVVIPVGCEIIKVSDCANSRGGLYNSSASKTWKDIGPFELGFENSLGYSDNGEFGYDTGMVKFCPSIVSSCLC